MSPTKPESVIMDMWEVPPGRQREVIDALRELLEEMRSIDGFVDGRIHASLDGSKVVSYSTMRSAADHQSFQERDEIRERMQALEAIAVPHRSAYQLECVFTAPTETGQRRCLRELSCCRAKQVSGPDPIIRIALKPSRAPPVAGQPLNRPRAPRRLTKRPPARRYPWRAAQPSHPVAFG